MTLYDMTTQAQALREMLDAEEIDEQAFNDTLESIGASEKIDSYCQIINAIAGDNLAIEAEISRLKARLEHNKHSIDRMRSALNDFMTVCGKKKEKTALFTVSYRKSQSVEIIDIGSVPEEYVKIKTEVTADKNAIKAALKSGHTIAGCQIKDTESLQIR